MCYNGGSGSVAQLVEQRPEEPCVAGSSPAGTTRTYLNRQNGRFFSSNFLLSTLYVLECYFVLILHKKCGKNCRSISIKLSVNTLNLNYLSASTAKSINQHSVFSYFLNAIKVFQIAIDIKSIFIIIIYKTPRTAHW